MVRRRRVESLAISVGLLLSWMAPAGGAPAALPAPAEASQTEPRRPRLALVLSGGGARGAAHIGVLKVLEELHVAPDLIVATSMGSLIGGFYAAGWSPAELEDLLRSTDWDRLFSDQPLREEKSYRRKQDDVPFMIPLKLRFRGLKPYIPMGAIGGQRLDLYLKTLEQKSTGVRDFDLLPIPYRAVATDLTNGRAVVLGSGSLSQAMRASMAVPAMFPPVEIDGQRLVDGGAAANMPVGIAQALGADAVIAIDITSPLAREDKVESLFSVLQQQTAFLTVGNRVADEDRLRPGDVLLRPDLGDISFSDFARAAEAIPAGEAAARAASESLRRFALSEDEWARFRATHVRLPEEERSIDTIRIENTSELDDGVVRSRLSVREGDSYRTETVSRDVLRLHALECFGTIHPDFDPQGQQSLVLPTPKPRYGRNSLQFGISVQDNFEGYSSYGISARHRLLPVNRRGGEWQTLAQIGDTTLLQTGFYQPLDLAMRWFVEPTLGAGHSNFGVWGEGAEIATYRFATRFARFDAGRVLGDWGEVRTGVFSSQTQAKLQVGLPLFPDVSEKDVGYQASFRVDTLDRTVFATHGMRAEVVYQRALVPWGSDEDSSQVRGSVAYAFRFGNNVLFPAADFGKNLSGSTTVDSIYTLGGFLRLTGLAPNELLGSNGLLARVVYYRNIFTVGLGSLRTPIYVGASVEAGNVYAKGEAVTFEGLRHGGSVFVSADTIVGPVYLAYGMADGGRRLVYLNIGARF